MSNQKPIHIIAFVGLAGSGKTTVIDHLTEKGYPKVYFGSIIMDALKAAGLEPTRENQLAMRAKLQNDLGEEAVTQRVIDQVRHLAEAGQHVIVLDGPGTWGAYRMVKHAFPGELTIVALLTSRHHRHHRLVIRTHDPLTEDESTERDLDEIEVLGKGNVIAMADYFVTNDGTPDELLATVDQLLPTITD